MPVLMESKIDKLFHQEQQNLWACFGGAQHESTPGFSCIVVLSFDARGSLCNPMV